MPTSRCSRHPATLRSRQREIIVYPAETRGGAVGGAGGGWAFRKSWAGEYHVRNKSRIGLGVIMLLVVLFGDELSVRCGLKHATRGGVLQNNYSKRRHEEQPLIPAEATELGGAAVQVDVTRQTRRTGLERLSRLTSCLTAHDNLTKDQ